MARSARASSFARFAPQSRRATTRSTPDAVRDPKMLERSPRRLGSAAVGRPVAGLRRRARDLLDALGRGDPPAAEDAEEEQDDRDRRR